MAEPEKIPYPPDYEILLFRSIEHKLSRLTELLERLVELQEAQTEKRRPES